VLSEQLVFGDQLSHVTRNGPISDGEVWDQLRQRYQRLTDSFAGAEETATTHPQRRL